MVAQALSHELENEVKKVMKDVYFFIEGWCGCSENILFSRAIQTPKELGLFNEFREKYGLPRTIYGIRSFFINLIDFMKEKMPDLMEELEEEIFSEDDDEDEE